MQEQTYVAFPLEEGHDGSAKTVDLRAHVEQLVEQLLFTAPGERVNRPTLGCGLMELVFDPSSDELSAATQFLVRSSLQEWLNGIIRVDDVRIRATGSEMDLLVAYQIVASGETFTLEVHR